MCPLCLASVAACDCRVETVHSCVEHGFFRLSDRWIRAREGSQKLNIERKFENRHVRVYSWGERGREWRGEGKGEEKMERNEPLCPHAYALRMQPHETRQSVHAALALHKNLDQLQHS